MKNQIELPAPLGVPSWTWPCRECWAEVRAGVAEALTGGDLGTAVLLASEGPVLRLVGLIYFKLGEAFG